MIGGTVKSCDFCQVLEGDSRDPSNTYRFASFNPEYNIDIKYASLKDFWYWHYNTFKVKEVRHAKKCKTGTESIS